MHLNVAVFGRTKGKGENGRTSACLSLAWSPALLDLKKMEDSGQHSCVFHCNWCWTASVAVPIPCYVGPIMSENTTVAIRMCAVPRAQIDNSWGRNRIFHTLVNSACEHQARSATLM